ncbi:hypothetical protein BUALT_Bualt02G0121300 [Buddleja alternifolia]|uniref:Uncharacterized protein n=1 Tax=Buddleja alternifolia TaxID=168488 RepID=A0AAV6Y033_9LAMI|nr:hypothetical protein BUALT_Bualt02G0121300 [Buddleja alternifolia]
MQSEAHLRRWYLQAAQAWVVEPLLRGGGMDIMSIKPTVALRAILVGGIAAFAKIGGAMKAAGGVKLGAAAAAMTAAASAAVSGSKQDPNSASPQPPK